MLMKMRSKMQNEKGFTLVELMVVVVILGILVAIAVPVYNSVTQKADISAVKANLRTIDGAIMTYQATNDAATVSKTDIEGLLQEWPKGPKSIVYEVTNEPPYRAYIETGPTPAIPGVEAGYKLENIGS